MTISQDAIESYIESTIDWNQEGQILDEIERRPSTAEDAPMQVFEEFWREERATHKRADGAVDRRTDKIKWYYESDPERAKGLLKKHYPAAFEKIDEVTYETKLLSLKMDYKKGRPSREINILFENLYGRIDSAESLYELSRVHPENVVVKNKRKILETLQAKKFKELSKVNK